MEKFKPEHMGVLAEFVIVGVSLAVAHSTKTSESLDDFFGMIKKRCESQGVKTEVIEEALSPINKAIKEARRVGWNVYEK